MCSFIFIKLQAKAVKMIVTNKQKLSLLTHQAFSDKLTLHFFWSGTQAVRDWSAKPSLVGSTPIHTFSGEFLHSRRTPKG